MENDLPKIKIKPKYFIIFGIFLILIASAMVFVPSQNWKRIFSLNFNKTAAVFQANTSWTSTSTGNWNDNNTWGMHVPVPFDSPYAIALDSNNNIYITNGRIYVSPVIVLNSDGTASTSYGAPGSSLNSTLYHPTDIKVSSSGYIYANGLTSLVILNPDGTLYKNIITVMPNSISLSNTDKIYVTGTTDPNILPNNVYVLNPDGTIFATYPVPNASKVRVSLLTGKIYVLTHDAYNNNDNKIVVLNSDGTHIQDYPLTGQAFDIELSSADQIYVDYYSNIDILNSDGSASTTISLGSVGSKGIALSPDGKIYSSNTNVGTVVIFNPDGSIFATYDGMTPNPSYVPVEGVDYPSIIDNVLINKGTVTLSSNQSIDNLTLAAGGTLNLAGYTLTIGHNGSYLNSGGTLITNGGNIKYLDNWTSVTSGDWMSPATWGLTSTTSIEGIDYPGIGSTVIINTGIITLSANQNVRNITLDTGGTLNLNGNTLNVAGDWSNTGGTFSLNPGNEGTVNLISASSQSILGNNTFENLTKTSTLASTLHFTTNSTTTITHNITLSGLNFGNLLSISATGYQPPQFVGYFNNQSSYVGGGDDQITHPYDVAFDSQDNMYVVDDTHHVQKFDSSGNFISKFGLNGTGAGQITTMLDNTLVIDSLDNIYVPSSFSLFSVGKINVYSSTTDFITSFGTYGTGDGQFSRIRGIAIEPSSGDIFVSDANRVEIFDPNGVFINILGTFGTGDGQFWLPAGIVFDSAGNIYVKDTSNNRIQVFNPNRSYKTQFAVVASYHGMAIDQSNNIYVTDYTNSKVQIFSTDGTFKAQFGTSGSGDNQFNRPEGIAVDNNDIIYVSDTQNYRIVKYSYASFPQFNIIQQINSGGVNNFSYLSVAGSINLSTSSFVCNTCVDGGNNINWTIPQRARSRQVQTIVSTSTATTSTLSSISIFPLNPSITVGSTTTFISTILDQYGNPFATTTDVDWKSSGPSIGTIDENGLFTAVSKGTTTITATIGIFSTSTLVTDVELKLEATSTEPIPVPKPKPRTVIKSTITDKPIIATTTLATTTVSTTTASTSTNTTIAAQNTNNNIVKNITDSIVASYQSSIITAKDIQNVKDVVTSPVGDAVTKTISTVGVVAGAGASISAVAFANPVTFAELWLLPAKLFGLLMGALGIRRKNRAWGTVYDSVTKRPLDPVYVSLINTETNKEVASAITDIDGRYGFLVLPGKYRIEAKKTNYIGPSVKMSGKSFDEVYNDLYFGNEMIIEKEGQIIAKNIPMDSLSFDWNEFAKTKMNVNAFMKGRDITWAKISKVLFFIGAIVSSIAVIFAPAPYNLIIAIFYVLAYIFNYIVLKTTKSGTLLEKNTKIPLSFAIVKIFREGEDSPLTKKIADKFGAYYALVPKGKYVIEIDEKTNDGDYKKVFKTDVMEIDTGIINMNFIV